MGQSNLTVVAHPLVQHKLGLLRSRETPNPVFRALLREVGMLLGYEVLSDLPLESITVETPLATMQTPTFRDRALCLVSILRAGNDLLDGFLELVPVAHVAHVGLYRDPETLEAVEYYYKAPDRLGEFANVVIFDPMLATGHSVTAAIDRLKTDGARSIKFVCLVAAPEGLSHLHAEHPDVSVVTAAVDDGLNEHGYIVPGLGDAGDRLYGTH